MIKVENVSKSLDKFRLKNISFELPEGYICGLVGENGAGKTSILNILLGLHKPDNGGVYLFGKSLKDNKKEILDNIGTVLVEDYFERELTLIENFEMYGKYFSRCDKERFLEDIKRFGLGDKLELKYKKISKGEKLKFQFAFALAHDPKLLILDEPTGNFDPDFRKEFFDSLSRFMANGDKSVILASHLTEDLDKQADYLLYIEKGEIVFSGDIESFRDSYKIIHCERYRINNLPKEAVIYIEENEYDTKALIKSIGYNRHLEGIQQMPPTIEEFMYGYSKRKEVFK